MRFVSSLAAMMLLLAACQPAPTRETKRLEDIISTMSCAQLTSELVYQVRIQEGLKAGGTKETSAGRAIATIFTLGYNVASQSGEQSDREERLLQVKKNISMLIEAREEQKCAS